MGKSRHLSPIPKLHPNKTIVIIAGGPSVTQADVDLTKEQVVIVINDAYQIAPWATYQYFCDKTWHQWHKDKPAYQMFEGLKLTQEKDIPGTLHVTGKTGKGLSESPERIHFGQNSGFQALNLAVHFGASRILLLGYDMKFGENGLAHWFGDHPNNVRSNYPAWLSNFSIAADQIKERGIEVINCSRDTALRCFKQKLITDIL